MEQERDAALADILAIAVSAAGKLLDADHSLRKPIKIEAVAHIAPNGDGWRPTLIAQL